MKFLIKLILVAFAVSPLLARAEDTDDERGYLVHVPRTQTFSYETLENEVVVSLHFLPEAHQVTTASELRFEDIFNHVIEIELFDRLALKPESELRIGMKTYPLKCLRAHGSGLAEDESDLRFVKIFFPLDDPDGQCVGPLDPDYPASGTNRYRWHKYLTIVWNGQDKRIIDAELTLNGAIYDLSLKTP